MPYGRYGFAPPPTAASGRTATGPPGGRATGPLTEPVGVGAAWVAVPTAELLHGMALLAEGGELAEPAAFVALLSRQLEKSLS